MPALDRNTATGVALGGFTIVPNAYPLLRLDREVRFSIAQRGAELAAADAPNVVDWINDAYYQILGMMDNARSSFSEEITLPATVSTLAFSGDVEEIINVSSVVDGKITTLAKSVDIEYWRSISLDEELDNALLNYYLHQDAQGLMLQVHPQSVATRLVLDGFRKMPRLVSETDCPQLADPLCVGLIDMAVGIAMRRLGDHTYAGVQQNAALGIVRSHIDDKVKSRRGTVAAITRPRTLEQARRPNGTQ